MKKAFMPLLFALVFICGCAGKRDFIKHPDGEFIAKNQNTAYQPLSRKGCLMVKIRKRRIFPVLMRQ